MLTIIIFTIINIALYFLLPKPKEEYSGMGRTFYVNAISSRGGNGSINSPCNSISIVNCHITPTLTNPVIINCTSTDSDTAIPTTWDNNKYILGEDDE